MVVEARYCPALHPIGTSSTPRSPSATNPSYSLPFPGPGFLRRSNFISSLRKRIRSRLCRLLRIHLASYPGTRPTNLRPLQGPIRRQFVHSSLTNLYPLTVSCTAGPASGPSNPPSLSYQICQPRPPPSFLSPAASHSHNIRRDRGPAFGFLHSYHYHLLRCAPTGLAAVV